MRLRLRDLTKVAGEVVDTEGVIKEVIGFRKYWFFKETLFRVAASKAMKLIKGIRDTDLSKLSYNEKGNIKKPYHVDNITFKAMMDLQMTIGNSNEDSDVVKVMSKVIAISCYQENIKDYYDQSDKSFDDFIQTILDEPLEDMVGLYNFICDEARESQLEWKRRFLSVEVPNPELTEAGISRMNQFNVLSTIKTLCSDFNCSYDEAWQMSYALTQTNSYSKATYDHIQDNLRQIKERKMRMNRRKHS